MNTIIFKETEDGVLMTNELSERLDCHYKSTDEQDYNEKCAFMARKKYGFRADKKIADTKIKAVYIEKYLTINGEDASEYIFFSGANFGPLNFNGTIALQRGYSLYKKLREANFINLYAAQTAYNEMLKRASPEYDEVEEIINNFI